MTEFGDALTKAINERNNDINSFVWKTRTGREIRMMDMSTIDLQNAYNHVNDMLYNRWPTHPGKLVIKENIAKAYDNCNAELLFRYILYDVKLESIKTPKDLYDLIISVKPEEHSDPVSTVFNGLPVIFEKVTVDKLLNACFNKLDVLNTKLITDEFILSQGIWLTKAEKKELTEYDDEGKMRKWLDVAKERLFLNDVRLRIDQRGLSYTELRSLLRLGEYPRFSELTTDTLKLLRDKILLILDNDLNYHVKKWSTFKNQIEKVAEYKGFQLVSKSY